MRLYLDASLLIAVLINEARGEDVAAWMDANANEDHVSSLWVEAEFSAALSIKARSGALSEEGRQAALDYFRRIRAESLTLLPIEDEHFHRAARLADRSDPGLRAGDALHLAIASGHGAKICTLDRRLAAAGPPIGVETEIV
ncbi:MAG: type II toxin-antitoxin system VapC family toxin [Caulobacteraceae bacterium]